MINYILQVILFQVLFLAIYDLFLSRETFFTKNRWYLLSTPMLSFLLPFIKIPTFQKAVSQEYIVRLPEILLSPEIVIQEAIEKTIVYESVNYMNILFWIGAGFFSIIFFMKLGKIINLIQKNDALKQVDFTLILIPNKTKAFSFFNYIFLGKEIPESQQEKIIQHELVHSKQKHSLDLLFFEFLKIVMWFNPMIYFYQKRITLLHEYISDAIVVKKDTKEVYINNLLSNFFQVENISFVNQFHKKSLIKKRIFMMTQKKSKKMNQLKYLVLIPVLMSMLFYSSCSESMFKSEITSKKQLQTLYRVYNEKLISFKGNRMSYLDNYLGAKLPEVGIEISFEELSKEEQNEFEQDEKHLGVELESSSNVFEKKFFRMPNGRNSIVVIIDNLIFAGKNELDIKEISFLEMNKMPIFPGCKERDADCFFKKLDKHFDDNFDKEITEDIFLSFGKKKVLVAFNIDTRGDVVDIEVNAPHLVIQQEVMKVISSLPKMTPGEKYGKLTKTKYELPFTILID